VVRTFVVLALLCASGCDRVFFLVEVVDAPAGDRDGDTDGADGSDAAPDACFTETFTDAGFDTLRWPLVYTDPGVTMMPQNGALSWGLATSATTSAYGLLASETRDLSESSLQIELLETANRSTPAEVGISVQSDETHRYLMMVTGATLTSRLTNDVTSDVSVPYDETAHHYLRLVFSGGIASWQTSPDAISWSTPRSEAMDVPLEAAHVVVFAGTYTSIGSPGRPRIDNLILKCK
jgi:hypothetical protein